jgi:hypothetical protein
VGARARDLASPYLARYQGFVRAALADLRRTPVTALPRLLAALLLAALGAAAAYALLLTALALLGLLAMVAALGGLFLLAWLLGRRTAGGQAAAQARPTGVRWDGGAPGGGELLADLDLLSPEAFVHLVAEVLRRRGYRVLPTDATRGCGPELIVVNHRGQRLVVVTRKHTPGAAVDVDAVQQVVAAQRAHGASSAMVVCNCGYTPAAQERARWHNVVLVDRNALGQLLAQTPGRGATP